MSLRQICKESDKAPKKALYLFPQEMKTGIASTRLILEKNVPFKVGNTVAVNWEGKRVQAEILALDGKSSIMLHKYKKIERFDKEVVETPFVFVW